MLYTIVLGVLSIIEFTNLINKISKKTLFFFKFDFYCLYFLIHFFLFLLFIFFSTKLFSNFTNLYCVRYWRIIVGKIFKGPKLTKLSPKKTKSGSVGSFLFSSIFFFSWYVLFYQYTNIKFIWLVYLLL